MANTCSLCRRDDRLALDRALIAGKPARAIAAEFGTTRSTVTRHRGHIRGIVEQVTEIREAKRVNSLLEDVSAGQSRAETLYRKAEAILAASLEEADRGSAVQAIRAAATVLAEARKHAELKGILTGELDRAREFRPFSVQILTPWAGASADQLPMVRAGDENGPDGMAVISVLS